MARQRNSRARSQRRANPTKGSLVVVMMGNCRSGDKIKPALEALRNRVSVGIVEANSDEHCRLRKQHNYKTVPLVVLNKGTEASGSR